MQSIIFKDIPCKHAKYSFGKGKYGEFEVIIEQNSGYINATKLCATGGKPFKDWLRLNGSISLIKYFNSSTQIHLFESDIKFLVKGGSCIEVRGTYVHELLVNPIVCWVSPKFTIFVSKIINEWKKQNESLYWEKVREGLKDSRSNNLREAEIRDSIAETLNGQIEVKTPVGRIDILTDTLLIEVKRACHWKHALGQVIAYGMHYPDHKQVIWLFDYNTRNIVMESTLNKLGIELRWVGMKNEFLLEIRIKQLECKLDNVIDV
jgi:hypothetical protein